MEPETQLPLTNPQSCIQVNNVLDLSKLPNSDWSFEVKHTVRSINGLHLFRMCLVQLWAGTLGVQTQGFFCDFPQLIQADTLLQNWHS
jgi:hypothetical protein